MKLFLKLLCVLCALCMLAGGSALAEGCGIGEAAYYCAPVPDQHTPPADVMPAVVTAAAPAEAPAAVSGVNPAYVGENSTKGFVYRMYKTVLGREPDEAGFSSWVAALDAGTATAADLVKGFFNSGEYTGKNKSSADVITDCYLTMLNRSPDAAGMTSWKAALDVGMSSDAVCAGFVGSSEFIALANQYGIRPGTITLTKARDQNYERTAFVYRLYMDCLNRAPELLGLEAWCKALGSGAEGTNVAFGFIFSKEYKDRLPDNAAFVSMLYRTILGRPSDKAGLDGWVNLLDYTSTREKVLNGFMFSPEFIAKCTKAGINVGNKIYEPDNDREWKANVLILSLVNSERAKFGLAPLKTREDLWSCVGMVRAREVGKYFSHTRPDGRDCWSAYSDAGFSYWGAAENIAYGYTTESSVMSAWMNSAGHRANILNASLTTLATGLFNGRYWSQNFLTEK